MKKENQTTKELEGTEQFVMLSRELIETIKLGKNGDQDVYHLVIIKAMANNFKGVAYTGVHHLMRFIGASTDQSSSKARTKESLLRLQRTGHIEIYDDTSLRCMAIDLKPANNYFIKPTGKDEEWGFVKVFYNDIAQIIMMNSNYKPKIFATYLNMVGNMFYGTTNVPLGFTSIDTIVKNTKINRKSVIEYQKALHDEKILYFIYFQITDTKSKNYCTRWVHKEHTAKWAANAAAFHNGINDYRKFKGGGIGVSEE